MSHDRLVATIGAFAIIITGCGSDKPASPGPSTPSSASQDTSGATSTSEATSTEETSTEADAPQAPLDDPDACTEVVGANLDMALASTTADAQKEADIFGKYNPPAAVKAAIDHFVDTEGPQLTDPKYDEYDKRITAWVHELCPS